MSEILPFPAHALPRFGCLLVRGVDARSYLQGQLSFDMDGLTRERLELASCNSSQGRVQAIVWMIERSEGILLILPAEQIEVMRERLRKYVMRAKVTIEPAPFVIGGSNQPSGAERSHQERDGMSLIAWPLARTLVVAPEATPMQIDAQLNSQWRLDDIRAGLPQVYADTHEAFVAQMLNIDLLGGISFEKGCYTGQEIVARTHFRGTVKRRMLRFTAACPPPAPGTRIVSSETHAGDVVDAAACDGGCELLAVISLAHASERLRLENSVEVAKVSLPYAIPELPPPYSPPATGGGA